MLADDAPPPPFFQARLQAPMRRVQVGLVAARVALAAVAAGAYFLPWHVVHQTSAGEGLGCLFAADCHPGPSGPVHDTGESLVCTGYSHHHGSVVVPLLAVALAGVALAGLRRSRLSVTLLLEGLGLGLCAGVLCGLFEILVHMFERVEPLWGERVFNVAFLLLGLSYVLGPALQCVMRSSAGVGAPSGFRSVGQNERTTAAAGSGTSSGFIPTSPRWRT